MKGIAKELFRGMRRALRERSNLEQTHYAGRIAPKCGARRRRQVHRVLQQGTSFACEVHPLRRRRFVAHEYGVQRVDAASDVPQRALHVRLHAPHVVWTGCEV